MQLSKGVQKRECSDAEPEKSDLNLCCFAGTTCFFAVRSALPKRSNSAWSQKMHTSFISFAVTPGSEQRHISGRGSLQPENAGLLLPDSLPPDSLL
jgi:hypothetical protein